MTKDDAVKLFEMLDGIAELRGRQQMSGTAKALFFSALQQFSFDQVRGAMTAHIASSQYMPQPNELIEWITGAKGNDGRPGQEEAWSMAADAMDEDRTVIITDEIAEAMGAVRSLMLGRDQVAARKAFQEAYERLVREARQRGRPIHWQAQLGQDRNHRAEAIKQAVRAGRLQQEQVQHLIPLPNANVYGLLADMSQQPGLDDQRRQKAMEALENLRRIISAPTERELEDANERRVAREIEAQRRELLIKQGKAA